MTLPDPVVLFVEGDIVVRHPLAEYLRECGYTVFEASSGLEAQRILAISDLQIAIVLADMTTEGSGFLLRSWMQERGHPAQVVLAGSIEKAVDRAVDICMEGPALAKPYDHLLVLDHIRRALARRNRNDRS